MNDIKELKFQVNRLNELNKDYLTKIADLKDKLHRRNVQIKGLQGKIEKLTPIKCCICGENIEIKRGWKDGNNALPIKNDRCCDFCNRTKVVPARLKDFNR